MKNNAKKYSMAGVGGLYQIPNFNNLQLANGSKCPTEACAAPSELANLKSPQDRPTNADILADLNRAKCAFQLRAIIAAMGRV